MERISDNSVSFSLRAGMLQQTKMTKHGFRLLKPILFRKTYITYFIELLCIVHHTMENPDLVTGNIISEPGQAPNLKFRYGGDFLKNTMTYIDDTKM